MKGLNMKTLLILLLLIVNAYSNVNQKKLLKEFNNLTVEQKKTMKEAFEYGEKHGLGLSLAAITWKESEFGRNKISPGGGNLGLTQININTYLNRYKVKRTKNNISNVRNKLIHDDKHNMKAAIDELKYWMSFKKKGESYKKVYARYNNGWKINSGGIAYANDVTARVKILEKKLKKT